MGARKIIFDTDPGVDDATALLLLLASPEVDLLGVTTVWGNGRLATTTRNALYLKDRFGFAAPVAAGADEPLIGGESEVGDYVHGANGLGDIPLPAEIQAQADPRPAHRFIADTLRAHPGEVTILAVGPLTNLALLLEEDPEAAALAAGVVIMGGAFGFNGHLGNVTPAGEANVWNDPEAADLVFGAPWDLVAIGLDVTHEVLMTNAWLADLRDAGGEAAQFIWEITRSYAAFYESVSGVDGIFAHDSLAAAYLVAPELLTLRSGSVRVVTEGIARGLTIQRPDARTYAPSPWEGRRSQRIATAVDAQAFLRLYRERIGRLG